MKLRAADLKLLMDYVTKEHVLSVDVLTANEGVFQPYVAFEFTDAESRLCLIKLFDQAANATPELTKSMKLISRVKEKKND